MGTIKVAPYDWLVLIDACNFGKEHIFNFLFGVNFVLSFNMIYLGQFPVKVRVFVSCSLSEALVSTI